MAQPTIDGLTAAQWFDLIESAVVREMSQAAQAKGTKIPYSHMESLRMGAVAGANALLQEFINRGLIKDSL
jgi:hypothetical protein